MKVHPVESGSLPMSSLTHPFESFGKEERAGSGTEFPVLAFRCGNFEVEVEPSRGAIVRLAFDGIEILRGGALDFSLNVENWKIAKTKLIDSKLERGEHGGDLRLNYDLTSENGGSLQVTQILEFHDHSIERGLWVRLSTSEILERLFHATLSEDGLVVGDPEGTLVSMPMTRSLPAMSREALLGLAGDPGKDGKGFLLEALGLDTGMAAAVFSHSAIPLQVIILPLPHECAVKARLGATADGFTFSQEFACESWLEVGRSLMVARQSILFSREPWQDSHRLLAERWMSDSYEPPVNRPDWALDAIILEVDLRFFGGLQSLIRHLDEIHATGFNTLYLLPWHPGHWNGYGTFRYDEVNPEFGTFADLRHLCDEAHRRGMRVLFDLLVNVAGEDSPYVSEHPEWFYRDGNGKILWHPTWRSWCFDPASPGFREFLKEYAVRCCREWGADGFRVDAAAHRGGSWSNFPGIQPHQHSHAIFTLLGEIRNAIREENPEAICMAECFGPAQVPISDLVAYQWVAWLDWANDGLLTGRLNGASLGRLLGEHFLAMPAGTWLTGYTHTHDTVAFEKRELDGPAVSAFYATLTLICAGTMTFGGGWQMRERPGPSEKDEYRALFSAKQMLGGIASHEITFQEQEVRTLLVVERPSRRGTVKVITNFGSAATETPDERAKIIYSRLGSQGRRIEAFDTIIVQP